MVCWGQKDEQMSDMSALEGRITAALDRIRQGIEAKDLRDGDAELRAALETERAANAELVARVRALKDRQDTQVASLTERVEKQRGQLAAYDAQMQTLRASNVQMREINTKLRDAVTEGLAPDLVNAAVAAELQAIQDQRRAEAAEIDAILTELKPLVEETSHAAG
jgi:murein L,D-transpeptidase YcbB/YkuD